MEMARIGEWYYKIVLSVAIPNIELVQDAVHRNGYSYAIGNRLLHHDVGKLARIRPLSKCYRRVRCFQDADRAMY